MDRDAIVGHVVCSRESLEPGGQPAPGLGPLGVHPRSQPEGRRRTFRYAAAFDRR